MTSLTIDFCSVSSARDVHQVLAKSLRFPDWYGHNWDAFRDLIASDYPLPDQLAIRGLDHLERILPREALRLLSCVGDYNNAGRGCSACVTDDYKTRMYYLRYEARPTDPAQSEGAVGAFINCWIKTGSARDADQRARASLSEQGWEVVSQDEVSEFEPDLATEDPDSAVRQACIDGEAFELNSWSSDDDN